MVVDNSLEALLSTLTASIESATQALPEDGVLPPKDGISLLDVKNEILLSYLQNLVFLILLKLRSQRNAGSESGASQDPQGLQKEVTRKLVELRVYLEKGVWPLENRLKYQIDKIIRAADGAAKKPVVPQKTQKLRKSNADDSDASDAEHVEEEEDMDGVSYGPNRSAFVRPKTDARDEREAESNRDGVYRPPRITPMTMPTTSGKEERDSRRAAGKSATMDEFVASEMSTAPLAEPSIGSTIVAGGRRVKSDKERQVENERREYEESNFTRLPALSKKERAKQARGHARQAGWGGEEWRGLGAGLDRIERLTGKKSGGGSASLGALDKSRKRPISDGPRGTGQQVGEAFEKRRKVVDRHTR